MNDHLYFIPILERALEQADVDWALDAAFDEITRTGACEPYGEGYGNFKWFMEVVYSHLKAVAGHDVPRRIAEAAAGTPDPGDQEDATRPQIVNGPREENDAFESFGNERTSGRFALDRPSIQVLSRKSIIGQLHFDRVPSRGSIDGIVPGHYVLKLLNTGWTIWHGELTGRELILTEAYGEVDLCLAAGAEGGPPTSEIDLLNDGEITLRTYAGIEAGTIEIELVR